MIALSSVGFRASGKRDSVLLEDVTLRIRKREYVALVGPNGAGKSVLLQLLAGLHEPTSGSITFDDTNRSSGSPSVVSPRVGIVFQNPDDQIVGSTVRHDVAFGLENLGVPSQEISRRVEAALEWSGLAVLADRPPHLLSDGEKQRVALTSALVLEPEILLLDEPTSRLDPPGRAAFLGAVHAARSETGATVVHVTHRSDEALPCDRIVGLRSGRLVFDGSPRSLLCGPEAESLGLIWSGLHQLRRELLVRGVDLGLSSSGDWNAIHPVLERVSN